ncbi:MAG TPA: phytase [Rhizomicrobium sp.]|nr:phytase [Rhizomicrobium sp.]
MKRSLAVLAAVLLGTSLAGQAQQAPVTANVTVNVPARGETVPVGTVAEDAADDPAIWRNARRPHASLIVATDKRAGLYVYGLDGKVRHFVPAGRVNNVDLIDMGGQGVIVVASDRNDVTRALLQLYRLDTAGGKLEPLGAVPGGADEAYGVCLMRAGGKLHAFSVLKNGTIEQVAITLGSRSTAGLPIGQTVRSLKLQTQTEGCVVDPRSSTLYVGEEDRGIWAFSARADGSTQGRLVAAVDNAQLVADVEGLTLMPSGVAGGWLIASSQGDNAYALFSLPSLKPAGRFRIAAGSFGATQETDGIAIAPGSFGPGYAGGLFVAQDGDNAPAAQNFKLVSWSDILMALSR